ncbi:LysR family transcriptional regulator [Segeticoccus rhizosphaerae]|uniref:LysR family transcriptional regulator n=1 Tax=Segeticoccus rhizosphaerae TaxID=1104777 RepID=UPI001EF15F84|nr:LysR family transcriptional regulator [Segeticoccus rhizosphaerae]
MDSVGLDVNRLRVLGAIARRGSMTGAAADLQYTPSAISQQVRRLEAEVGQPVLERHTRGVRLTDAGRAIVRHLASIDNQLAALQSELDDIAGLRAGSLRLGTFPTVAASLLPVAVNRFHQEHPGVDLKVVSARLEQLMEHLERRRVEMTLLWDYPWSRIEVPELELIELLQDPTEVVVSATHHLAGRGEVRMAELAHESWVTRGGAHPVAEVLSWTALRAGFEPTVAFEANDYQEAQAMVAVGLGVALAPRLALANLRDDVTVLSLGDEAPRRRILLAALKGRSPTPAERAMAQVLRDVGAEAAADLGSARAARDGGSATPPS